MLMFLLGLPNQFTQWCEALTAKLAESASRSRLCSTAGRSEELLHTMIEHPSQRVFISQQQPSGSIGYSPRQMGAALLLSTIRAFASPNSPPDPIAI